MLLDKHLHPWNHLIKLNPLKKNICNYSQFNEINELFSYKREDSPEWKCLAKV